MPEPLDKILKAFKGFNMENVKNIGGSLGGSLAHWLSVL